MKHSLILAAVGLALMGSSAYACTCGTGTHQVGDVCVADPVKGKAGNRNTNSNTLGQGQDQTQGQGQSQTGTVTGSNRSTNNVTSSTGPSTATSTGGSVGNTSATGGTGGAGGSAQGGNGGTGQGGASSAESSQAQTQGNGNSQTSSTTYTEPRAPVMTAFAMASNTTAECRYGDALGVQTFGLGLSASKSRADKDCRLKVMADVEYTRGNNMAGDKLTCLISYVHEALGADCEALLNEQPRYVPKQYSEAEVHGLLDKQAAVLKAGK